MLKSYTQKPKQFSSNVCQYTDENNAKVDMGTQLLLKYPPKARGKLRTSI